MRRINIHVVSLGIATEQFQVARVDLVLVLRQIFRRDFEQGLVGSIRVHPRAAAYIAAKHGFIVRRNLAPIVLPFGNGTFLVAGPDGAIGSQRGSGDAQLRRFFRRGRGSRHLHAQCAQ